MLTQIILMAPQDGASSSGNWSTMILMVGVFVVMYFFMIRPQSKKAKDQKTFIENIAKGAKIVTVSGVHGRISKVNEDGTLDIDIANNTTITMERSGISMEMTKTRQEAK